MGFNQILLCVKTKPDYPYQRELSEPLKEPKDIIDAVEQSRETGDHAEIHKILTNRNINLSKTISTHEVALKSKPIALLRKMILNLVRLC